jgi:dihydrofolate reductase
MSLDVSMVIAMDNHRAIGKNGQLPWRLPDDLKHFKARTIGKPVLMGRKTHDSIGRPLPERRNIVLTRDQTFNAPGIQVVHTLEQALEGLEGPVAVIGGGEICALAMPLARRLELTFVNTVVKSADAFFPEWNPAQWREVARVHHPKDEKHAFDFDFVDFERV